jgi:hypothetical protein
LQFGPYPFYFGPIGINLTIVILGLFVLALAIIQRMRRRQTRLFEISSLLLLAGFLFLTLHGQMLQLILPISLPEKPLVDNNLTLNYTLSNALAFMIFPILLLNLWKSDISLATLGLRVFNKSKTAIYTFLGVTFNIFIFLFTNTFFGFKWISRYTLDGVVLWILLVTFASVFIQTLFFFGILFNKYLNLENGVLLALISILAFHSYTVASLPWVLANVLHSCVKTSVIWKTRNIYGAVLMGIATNLIDILIQI